MALQRIPRQRQRGVVTNDRWGAGCLCQHGGFFTCADRYAPGTLQPHKYEGCFTVDRHSWGYRREARIEDFLSTTKILHLLVSVVATDGNFLLNVGPDHLGIIHPIFEERLRQIGAWLDVNGEAIYATRPWERAQTDPAASGVVWYTTPGKAQSTINSSSSGVFAILLEWPEEQHAHEKDEAPVLLHLASPRVPAPATATAVSRSRWRGLRPSDMGTGEEPTVSLLGYGDPLVPWREAEDGGIVLNLSQLTRKASIPKREWAWVFVLERFA